MKPEQNWKCRKYSTVVGAAIMLLPNGLYMSWGNLSVYSLSYLIFICDDPINEQSAWVLCMFVAFWTIFAILSSFLIKKLGKMACLVIGLLISDLAVFLGYFSIQNSLITLTLTQGVITGTGTGLVDSTALQLVIDWADDDAGQLTAAVQAALALGGFFTNLLITAYINPDNLSTNISLGRNEFFSQTTILDRVPYGYLVLGGFSLGVHLLGLMMMRPRRPEDEYERVDVKLEGKDEECSTDIKLQTEHETKCETQNERTVILEKPCFKSKDYKIKEMIKTSQFYALWITFFLGGVSLLLIDNYYKAFGQLYIHDDHFLTNLGAVLSLFTAVVGFFWGFLMDKAGVKFALLLNLALVSVGQVWYWFSPMPSKWLYSFMTVLMASLAASVFSTYTAATALLFGSKNFASNYGVVMSSMLVFNIIAPFIAAPLLTYLGWWPMYTLGGALNIIRIIITMIWIPHM